MVRSFAAAFGLAFVLLGAAAAQDAAEPAGSAATAAIREAGMQVQYLEIVTTEVEETCAALAAPHGVVFSDAVEALGGARVAELANGGRIGVRAPMAEHESPLVRPYMLVEDIHAATAAAQAAGAEFAMTANEIPGQGAFAIYMLGGVQHGLWEQ